MATKGEIREYFARFGKQGGKMRAKNMTPEQRSASARKAVEARWAQAEQRLTESMRKMNANLKALKKLNRSRRKKKGSSAR
ncbi:MAG: hypothetical protein WAN03_10635 [Candidatus Sulfotelmatobacter sp.]